MSWSVCFIFLYNSGWNIFLSDKYIARCRWDVRKTHEGFQVESSSLLSDINQNWNASTNFSYTARYKTSWKSVERCRVVTCGHTDVVELRGAFFTTSFRMCLKSGHERLTWYYGHLEARLHSPQVRSQISKTGKVFSADVTKVPKVFLWVWYQIVKKATNRWQHDIFSDDIIAKDHPSTLQVWAPITLVLPIVGN
jgi:hypothetical protein